MQDIVRNSETVSTILAVCLFYGIFILLPVELYNFAIFHGNTSFRCSPSPYKTGNTAETLQLFSTSFNKKSARVMSPERFL
jgi:hypothetical protein